MGGDTFTLLKTAGVSVTCNPGAHIFNGVKQLSGPASTFSLGGGFSYLWGCKMAEVPAKVFLNGCTYDYQVANAGPPYSGSVAISCPAGKAIEISTTDFCSGLRGCLLAGLASWGTSGESGPGGGPAPIESFQPVKGNQATGAGRL